MTPHRGAYLAALVAAVLVLAGSVTAVVVYVASTTATAPAAASQPGGWGGWSSGPGGQSGADDGHWGGMGGMMNDGQDWMDGGWTGSGGWTGGTGSPVTADQARTLAQDWVDTNAAGASVDTGTAMSGAYRFTVTRDGQTIAVVWVEASTGRLGVQAMAAPSPAS